MNQHETYTDTINELLKTETDSNPNPQFDLTGFINAQNTMNRIVEVMSERLDQIGATRRRHTLRLNELSPSVKLALTAELKFLRAQLYSTGTYKNGGIKNVDALSD